MAEPLVLQRIAAYPAFVACVSSAWASAAKTGLRELRHEQADRARVGSCGPGGT